MENAADLVLNAVNAFIALNLSKRDMPFHAGVMGACGMLTSGIQLWQICRSHSLGVCLAERLSVPEEHTDTGVAESDFSLYDEEKDDDEGGKGCLNSCSSNDCSTK